MNKFNQTWKKPVFANGEKEENNSPTSLTSIDVAINNFIKIKEATRLLKASVPLLEILQIRGTNNPPFNKEKPPILIKNAQNNSYIHRIGDFLMKKCIVYKRQAEIEASIMSEYKF